jgi:acyl-CoA thioesterase
VSKTEPSFDTATDWPREGDARRGQVPSAWMQGRASFGGLVAAVMVRAMREHEPTLPLRAVHIDFIGPLTASPATARAEVLRRGRSLTHLSARIDQDTGVCARASASFGAARNSSIAIASPMEPDLPDPTDRPAMPFIPGVVPSFVQFIDMTFVEGGYPFSGQATAELAGWCRHRTNPGPPEPAIMGLLDAWPAPVLSLLDRPAPASSVSWTTRVVSMPESVGTDDWFWYRSSVSFARDGYAHMEGRLWDREGRAVASLEQLVAVFDQR